MIMGSSFRLHTIVVLAGLLLSGFSGALAQRPNIIYIMTDDMGYADLGAYGAKNNQTPNLDKLASEGIRFMEAYSAAPLCTPTRTAFMTGRYPAQTPVGLYEPLTSRDSIYGLSADYPSVASLLKDKGYETALIGKWHLGFIPVYSPTRNGFDYFFGFHSGAADYISHKGDGKTPDLYENEKPVRASGYLTELLSQKAVSFLKTPHSKPFFLTLNYNAPHWPWQGSTDKAYPDTMDFRVGGSATIYAAMMKSLDDGVGAVIKTIDEQGLAANTIIIFTNDNGGERYSDNGIFSKGKSTLWEGGIRVPAFIRWPGKISAGRSTSQAAITMDWTATILAAAGGKAHPDFPFDGIDLMPLCRGNRPEVERTFYWRTFQRKKQKAIREGKWKYLQDEQKEYLFDLKTDPGETNDLKAANADVFQRLKGKYAEWEKKMLKPFSL